MEGQQLQGDDTEDALQTVHGMWQLDGLVGILSHVRVILATKDDWPALTETESDISHLLLHYVCVKVHVSRYAPPELTDLAVTCCRAFWHLL